MDSCMRKIWFIEMELTPTYLYIKRHSKTNLKYFGKTTLSDVEKYCGSGVYWKKHIEKYGKQYVETLWVSEPFYDKELLEEFAVFFSDFFEIETSSEWANLIAENGLDGAPKGIKREGLSGEKNGMYGKRGSLNPFYGKQHTESQKQLWSEMRLGEKNPNFKAKSFNEETYKKLRRPKSSKANYKGTPGKITCIDIAGIAVQIDIEIYNQQKQSNKPVHEWQYVNTNSNEAKKRKLAKLKYEDINDKIHS
jgi:hypothetical protein